uniref:Transposase n=1 Tax=Hydatigena taeniaeformis TaxID=6205 RepID=A0A0R3WSG2_HYDTA
LCASFDEVFGVDSRGGLCDARMKEVDNIRAGEHEKLSLINTSATEFP